MRRYFKLLFQIMLVVTIFFTGSRVLAANEVEVTNIELYQKSDDVEVNSTTYSDSVLNTNPILHNLNDYVTYKITIKNNDDVKHNILDIKDDNNSKYITTSYTHDDSIEAGSTSEILMTVKLTKLVDDVNLLNNEDIYSLGEINITLSLDDGTIVINTNPKTGDIILKYVTILLVSILTLVLVIMKKKKSAMAMLITTLFVSTTVLASTTINLQVKVNENSIQVKVETYNVIDGEGNEYKYVDGVDQILGVSESSVDGYNFVGFSTTENGTVEYQNGDIINRTDNLILYPVYEPTTYEITYDLAGGSISVENPTSYNIEESVTLNNPTKDHYEFAGWTGTDLSSATNNVVIPTGSTGNRNYTATWTAINYTITYNLNGGNASNPTSYNVESGNMTLSEPTRNGYEFTGWTGTGLVNSSKKVVIVSTEGGNREYTATWTPVNYTITYDLDDGTLTNENPENYNIETSNFTLWNPEKEGYTFAGWVGTNLSNPTMNVTINTGSTGNRTYTATWTPVNYKIAYNLNGGEATNPTTYTVESEDITLNNPTKRGYEFTGWTGTGLEGAVIDTTIPTGSTGNRVYSATWKAIDYDIDYEETYNSVYNPTSYTIESNNIILKYPSRYGYRFVGWIGTDLDEPTMDVVINSGSIGDREYTATWTLKEYQVTYIDGDSITNETVTHGFEAPNKTEIGKTGYEFKFWSLTENGVEYDFTTPVVQELTLFAVYKPIDYPISYNLDGGSVLTPNPGSYNIESSNITLVNPTKPGHTFIGWTGTGLDEVTQTVTIASGSMGDRSYTAVYSVNNHTVIFNDNGNLTNETVVDGEYAVEINASGKTGYEFKHWSTSEQGSAYDFNTPVTSNLLLYAVYEAINYSITYNLDNGSVKGTNPTSYTIESSNITLINPTKTGYTFAGWTGTGLSSPTMSVTINTGSTGSREYTATYTINSYTITYNDQEVLSYEEVDYGATAPEKDASGKEGYTFKYWSLSREGSAYDFTTPISDNITLFAVYEPKFLYDIIFLIGVVYEKMFSCILFLFW